MERFCQLHIFPQIVLHDVYGRITAACAFTPATPIRRLVASIGQTKVLIERSSMNNSDGTMARARASPDQGIRFSTQQNNRSLSGSSSGTHCSVKVVDNGSLNTEVQSIFTEDAGLLECRAHVGYASLLLRIFSDLPSLRRADYNHVSMLKGNW